MAASADKIKQLLGNGLSNEVVATAVGVHPSYVSQLMSDENFAAEVVALRTETLAASTQRDRTWDSAEDKVLVALHEQLDAGSFYKPMDILRAAAVINVAKRRGNPAQDSLVVNQQVVTLNMPVQVIHSFTKNSTGEVIEADGQTLVPMTAATLMAKLSAKNKGRPDYEQVRRYLPQTSEDKES